eukprot:scaffold319_cov122-Isochrysis_galbana.AAC.2
MGSECSKDPFGSRSTPLYYQSFGCPLQHPPGWWHAALTPSPRKKRPEEGKGDGGRMGEGRESDRTAKGQSCVPP